ncbi:hypothetical protein [Antiquaquibacter soli]|uniref:Uncharacterized protein n=1 Tax=Antiquaquibacter soli TaxID=3064523 RepID=A0ABT9BQS0_9MICO|nr:hypothetical protein [Protaetiibacter sp. WY-16]MDO7883363.1 hypothetical protein [Protaetiibacter sp. WY-16]
MTIPHYDTVRDEPLPTDDAVLSRLDDLLEEGLALRLWFMFLDDESYQLPLLLPMDLGGAPGSDDVDAIARFIDDLAAAVDAATAIVVVEWGDLDHAEIAVEWMRVVAAACSQSGVDYRGPFECSPFGVRPLG